MEHGAGVANSCAKICTSENEKERTNAGRYSKMDVLINLQYLIRESYITGHKKEVSLSQMELANAKR